MKRTKIICTLGPACDNDDILKAMIESGMDIARLNFSHGTYEEQRSRIERVRRVGSEIGRKIPLMLDTKGPEFRIGTFAENAVIVNDGDEFTFTADDLPGDSTRVSVSYKKLAEEMQPGDIILVNDGLVKFEVLGTENGDVKCRVLIGGKLSNRKSMSFPGKVLHQVYLSEQDKSDLLFGIANGIDIVACSFVSTAQDVLDVRNFLNANGGASIKLTAKIENQSGVDHAEEILDHCEGLMVARGDLGVEVPFAKLPVIQKRLLRICISKRAFSITATEMLESMITNPRPTRAEVSDIANAVFDGSNAIMLSGETAAGSYPAEAVAVMAQVAEEAESYLF